MKNAENSNKNFRRQHGFASTLVALLAVAFASALAALLLSSTAHERVLLATFESRKAANHFENAVAFLNSSFRDALFDSQNPNSPGGLDELAPAYLRLAVLELNASGVETSFTDLRVQSRSEQPFEGFNYAVVANASLSLFVRLPSVFKNESVFLEQRIDVNNTSSDWKALIGEVFVVVPAPTPLP
ncbi:MAG: hypothetical protein QW343_00925 [Candidatus Norongarragalinales archaeon]